jgi:hypothetical protein
MFLRRYAGIAFSLACIAMVSACGSSSTATGSTSTATGSSSTATGSTSTAGSAPTTAPSVPAAGGATGSACNLVSASDLQSLTGATSATVVSDLGAGTGDALCAWDLKPGLGAAAVTVLTGASAEQEAPIWAQFQTDPAVSGVGAEAHWDATKGMLLVKVGAGYALFSVVAANGSTDELAATKLAKLVVPKLGG